VTVEEVKDEDDASHLPSPHQAVDATDSLFKYPRAPNHNEGIPIDAKCGNPAGEVATSSLPALEARESQPLPFCNGIDHGRGSEVDPMRSDAMRRSDGVRRAPSRQYSSAHWQVLLLLRTQSCANDNKHSGKEVGGGQTT
jgi:hypothetical protein